MPIGILTLFLTAILCSPTSLWRRFASSLSDTSLSLADCFGILGEIYIAWGSDKPAFEFLSSCAFKMRYDTRAAFSLRSTTSCTVSAFDFP